MSVHGRQVVVARAEQDAPVRLRPGFRPVQAFEAGGVIVVVGRRGRISTFDASTQDAMRSIRVRDAVEVREVDGALMVRTATTTMYYDPRTLEGRTAPPGHTSRLAALEMRISGPGRSVLVQGADVDLPPDVFALVSDVVEQVLRGIRDTKTRTRISLTANAFWATVEVRHPSLDEESDVPDAVEHARTRFAARVDRQRGLLRVAVPLRG